MRSKVSFLVLVVMALVATSAFANRGGWISSGGEVFRFDRNPWFVKNTKTVQYCLVVDSATVTASVGTVREAFESALRYWKNEFAAGFKAGSPGLIVLGNQDFVEGPCGADTDLAVKVGYGALSAEEIEHLTRPEEKAGGAKSVESYIGVSIRKEYDFKAMKGKGTLFIASDSGPRAYRNDGQLVAHAWRNPKLLQYAFMHELGHVFGVPHTGVGLMSEVFLEQVLSRRMSPFYIQQPIQPFLSAPEHFEVCTFSGTFNPKFFQLKEETACLLFTSLKEAGTAGNPRWKVSSKKYATSDPVEIGTVRLESPTAKVNGAKPMVTVQLPDEQQVFTLADRGFASFLLGGILHETDYQGALQIAGSLKPYPVFASLKPDSVTLIAQVDGKMLPVLVYAPPSLIQMLIPIGGR